MVLKPPGTLSMGIGRGSPGGPAHSLAQLHPKGLPSATALIFLPVLSPGQPRGAHSLPTTHRAQFSNSATP